MQLKRALVNLRRNFAQILETRYWGDPISDLDARQTDQPNSDYNQINIYFTDKEDRH